MSERSPYSSVTVEISSKEFMKLNESVVFFKQYSFEKLLVINRFH